MIKTCVLGSGNGSNFEAIALAAKEGRLPLDIRLVICDRPGAFILRRAEKLGFPRELIDHKEYANREDFEKEIEKRLVKHEVELVVLAGFMRVLTPYLVGRYRLKIVNIHPSLLPSFKGANAVRDALDYGTKITGVTVHFIDEGVDSGPIIAQEAVPVEQGDTFETLSARIHAAEHRLYVSAIDLLARGKLKVFGRKVHLEKSEEKR